MNKKNMDHTTDYFHHNGFALYPQLLSAAALTSLQSALHTVTLAPLRGGIRHIDRLVPAVAALTDSAPLQSAARKYLSGQPQLVRAIYFDKSLGNNWLVGWHQDRTVAVSQRFDADGWGPWSRKDGVWHVQPPLAVLQDMVTIRLHLDAATPENGCLKLIPGSHRNGLLHDEQVAAAVQQPAFYCTAAPGDALLMRPHLLHASEKTLQPQARRILHFEYTASALPNGIGWRT